MFEMKEEYMTGIELVDNEHRKLFEIAESVYQLLKNEFIPDKYDHIVLIIQELKDYTAKHFHDEEEYMESIDYRRLYTQKMQHKEFINKIEAINLDKIEEDGDTAIMDILNLVNNWLVNHILHEDKRINQQ